VSEFEQGEIGPDCSAWLQTSGRGRVSKRRDRPITPGSASADWIKVKNRKHPAIERVKESFS